MAKIKLQSQFDPAGSLSKEVLLDTPDNTVLTFGANGVPTALPLSASSGLSAIMSMGTGAPGASVTSPLYLDTGSSTDFYFLYVRVPSGSTFVFVNTLNIPIPS